MSWSGLKGDKGPPGPRGCIESAVGVGVPSPQSVTQIQATLLLWEYIAGSEIMERLEVWHDGRRIATGERSIGVIGGGDD